MSEKEELQSKITKLGQRQASCWQICATFLLIGFLRRNDTVAKDATHALYAELFRAFFVLLFLAVIGFSQWQKNRCRRLLQISNDNIALHSASHTLETKR